MQRMRKIGIAMIQRKSSDIVMLLDPVEIPEASRVVGVMLAAVERLINVTWGDRCDLA